jgi:hypothetical protein
MRSGPHGEGYKNKSFSVIFRPLYFFTLLK